jgi:L-alanine-DL-glutamate epimerase-like enolase superfamily enzyme
MTLSFYPYQLNLCHTFTVATCSRSYTPAVLVEIEHDGLIGYGEASMPPYLGETTESVRSFLQRVNLGRFSSPLNTEEILQYVDSIEPGNCAAKASIDIALMDLVGKMKDLPARNLLTGKPLDAEND